MFDLDDLIADCHRALAEPQPLLAIKEVLERAVARPEQLAAALPPTRAEAVPLFASDDLTVLKAVWAPGMSIPAHNHLMWAALGIYSGQEDNTFYRRSGDGRPGVVVSGGRQLDTGDVALLGDDTIHAVANPRATFTAAIHVYGGNLVTRAGRSEWDPLSGEEAAYDFGHTQRRFEEANALVGLAHPTTASDVGGA